MYKERITVQSNRIEWSQFLILVLTIIGMFFLSSNMVDAIRQDIKDFHGRLCTIEERNKNKE